MPVFEFSATIGPGMTHRWWTGGNGWYHHDKIPQMDAHTRWPPNPGDFVPEVPNTSPPLIYKDFASAIGDTWPYDYSYFVSVQNTGSNTMAYHMRVWVP